MDSTSGYWADPFPAMESPLCAVIDPTRDFRWHALRCGGPETAAFLCEMEGKYRIESNHHVCESRKSGFHFHILCVCVWAIRTTVHNIFMCSHVRNHC